MHLKGREARQITSSLELTAVASLRDESEVLDSVQPVNLSPESIETACSL
jgi:hypothetical protein